MKSGLEGRNNARQKATAAEQAQGLNEVRPRRPEQSADTFDAGLEAMASQ